MAYTWKKLFIRKDCDLPTFSAAILTAYDIIWRHTKFKKEYLFVFFKNNNIHYYIRGIDEFAPGRSWYRRKYFTREQIEKTCKVGVIFLRNTKQQTAHWQKRLAVEPNKKNLIAAFSDWKKDFRIINYEYSILPWWALEAWQNDFLAVVNSLIKKNHAEAERDAIMATLLKPGHKTAIEEIQRKFRAGVPIRDLVNQYQFLRSWTAVWSKPLTDEWIKEVVKKTNSGSMPSMSYAQIYKLLQPNAKEKKFLESASHVTFFKDYRDEVRRQQAFLWNFLFSSLAEYFGMPHDDLGYLTIDELSVALREGKIDKNLIIQRREKGCVLTVAHGKLRVKVVDSPDYDNYQAIVEAVENENINSIVTGIVGQKGVARGPVCIIRHYKDVFKIQTGDILVTNTTHPNYLVGMHKAAAFVTDEGGIACHAAIVAREMGKPCIVGTKVSTRFFKDGDMVEVDADKGVVQKV